MITSIESQYHKVHSIFINKNLLIGICNEQKKHYDQNQMKADNFGM